MRSFCSRSFICLSDLTVAADDEFVGNELIQAHGASGVQLLRGDADLRAEPELAAIREARGRVYIDRRRIDLCREPLRRTEVLSDDAFAVAGRILRNVRDSRVKAVYDAHG